jgi:toxin ParE1/3/4
MARNVIWAYAAEEDLEAAASYIHRDSPAYAVSFIERALEAGRSLNEFAERGRVVPELSDSSIREIFIYSYRLVYRIEDNRISILALIHGRRDFQKAWNEKAR